ncbi:MAG: leucine-rich repeat protein [Clostridia bacterium]|nr:leucine-rich repeat protein [Clostridia bacterium]
MLIISSVMITAVTYAWISLSSAPEVKNISANIAANGNLEIALADSGSLSALDSLEELVGPSGFVDKNGNFSIYYDYAANSNWGNLVDLSSPDYGLGAVSLYPAVLNIKNGVIADNPLKIAGYGSDGRVYTLSENTASALYDKTTRSFASSSTDKYGVRALGTDADSGVWNVLKDDIGELDNRSAAIYTQSNTDIFGYLLAQDPNIDPFTESEDIVTEFDTVQTLAKLNEFVDAVCGTPAIPATDSAPAVEATPGLMGSMDNAIQNAILAYSGYSKSYVHVSSAKINELLTNGISTSNLINGYVVEDTELYDLCTRYLEAADYAKAAREAMDALNLRASVTDPGADNYDPLPEKLTWNEIAPVITPIIGENYSSGFSMSYKYFDEEENGRLVGSVSGGASFEEMKAMLEQKKQEDGSITLYGPAMHRLDIENNDCVFAAIADISGTFFTKKTGSETFTVIGEESTLDTYIYFLPDGGKSMLDSMTSLQQAKDYQSALFELETLRNSYNLKEYGLSSVIDNELKIVGKIYSTAAVTQAYANYNFNDPALNEPTFDELYESPEDIETLITDLQSIQDLLDYYHEFVKYSVMTLASKSSSDFETYSSVKELFDRDYDHFSYNIHVGDSADTRYDVSQCVRNGGIALNRQFSTPSIEDYLGALGETYLTEYKNALEDYNAAANAVDATIAKIYAYKQARLNDDPGSGVNHPTYDEDIELRSAFLDIADLEASGHKALDGVYSETGSFRDAITAAGGIFGILKNYDLGSKLVDYRRWMNHNDYPTALLSVTDYYGDDDAGIGNGREEVSDGSLVPILGQLFDVTVYPDIKDSDDPGYVAMSNSIGGVTDKYNVYFDNWIDNSDYSALQQFDDEGPIPRSYPTYADWLYINHYRRNSFRIAHSSDDLADPERYSQSDVDLLKRDLSAVKTVLMPNYYGLIKQLTKDYMLKCFDGESANFKQAISDLVDEALDPEELRILTATTLTGAISTTLSEPRFNQIADRKDDILGSLNDSENAIRNYIFRAADDYAMVGNRITQAERALGKIPKTGQLSWDNLSPVLEIMYSGVSYSDNGLFDNMYISGESMYARLISLFHDSHIDTSTKTDYLVDYLKFISISKATASFTVNDGEEGEKSFFNPSRYYFMRTRGITPDNGITPIYDIATYGVKGVQTDRSTLYARLVRELPAAKETVESAYKDLDINELSYYVSKLVVAKAAAEGIECVDKNGNPVTLTDEQIEAFMPDPQEVFTANELTMLLALLEEVDNALNSYQEMIRLSFMIWSASTAGTDKAYNSVLENYTGGLGELIDNAHLPNGNSFRTTTAKFLSMKESLETAISAVRALLAPADDDTPARTEFTTEEFRLALDQLVSDYALVAKTTVSGEEGNEVTQTDPVSVKVTGSVIGDLLSFFTDSFLNVSNAYSLNDPEDPLAGRKTASITYGSDPAYHNILKKTVTEAVTGSINKNASKSANKTGSSILVDTYAFAVDLFFRTNAADNALMLQTAPVARVDSDYIDNSFVQGQGSYVSITRIDDVNDEAIDVINESLRFVFAETLSGKVLAVGKSYPNSKRSNDQTLFSDIYLCNYSIDASGNIAVENIAGSAEIVSLIQNMATPVSVYVYLDGNYITNADASALRSIKIDLNLQFSSKVGLKSTSPVIFETGGQVVENIPDADSEEEDPVGREYTGMCGEEAYYLLENGIFTVFGSGAMSDYTSGETPWEDSKSSIMTVIVEKGITKVGDYAFAECANLTEAYLPNTVTKIETDAFKDSPSLISLYFNAPSGNLQWQLIHIDRNCNVYCTDIQFNIGKVFDYLGY